MLKIHKQQQQQNDNNKKKMNQSKVKQVVSTFSLLLLKHTITYERVEGK